MIMRYCNSIDAYILKLRENRVGEVTIEFLKFILSVYYRSIALA